MISLVNYELLELEGLGADVDILVRAPLDILAKFPITIPRFLPLGYVLVVFPSAFCMLLHLGEILAREIPQAMTIIMIIIIMIVIIIVIILQY